MNRIVEWMEYSLVQDGSVSRGKVIGMLDCVGEEKTSWAPEELVFIYPLGWVVSTFVISAHSSRLKPQFTYIRKASSRFQDILTATTGHSIVPLALLKSEFRTTS